MSWQQLEYICKGIYLGLLLFVALQQPARGDLEVLLLCPLGGLALALGLAAAGKLRAGYRVKGRVVPFILFLLLESPSLVYAGTLAGMTLAAFLVPKTTAEPWLMPATIVGGAVLGLGFGFVRQVKNYWPRSLISLVLVAAPAAVIGTWVYFHPGFALPNQPVGLQLLFGIPFFYALTLAGRAEETEVEIAAIGALLALGLAIWRPFPSMGITLIGVPVLLYFAYTMRYLPAIRVFKHTLRGLSYAGAGRHRQALQTFQRALQLDPQNIRAREGLWSVHRSMDLVQAAKDPSLASLVDVDMCLRRAEALLIEARPTPEQVQEAKTLLDFVLNQRPAQRPTVLYWRAVLHLKTGQAEQAAEELTGILDPAGYPAADPSREAILLRAWQLALVLHPEMQQRVGAPQLALPGRRMQAIAAVERRLAANPDNPAAWDLKRLLYSNLTEAEYEQAAPAGQAAPHFDHAYVLQLGLGLIQDPGRWLRGAEFLRSAARGLPAQGPSIYVQIARAADKAGDPNAAWRSYRVAQEVGRAVGPKNLTEEDRQAYFATVKMLAEDAVARNDLDVAIESYQLYSENERSGLETLRTLASLYEKKGDQASVLNALRVTEQALVYNGADPDLLKKKDHYYRSVDPDTLQARLDAVSKYFDVAYCLRKAKATLDARYNDPALEQEWLDYALHLALVAQAVSPGSVLAKVLEARARLRRGERDRALWHLENLVHEQKPEKFATGDDEEAWYLANRLLGDLYLNDVARPDLAIGCYTEYRKSAKSGADTLYKLGQSYEGVGDVPRAKKFYEQVTGYDGHPLAYDARQALYRLQNGERRD